MERNRCGFFITPDNRVIQTTHTVATNRGGNSGNEGNSDKKERPRQLITARLQHVFVAPRR
ncbi:MAG: hypothetical protein M1524_04210 [Patescibacteria group bacterium]|nr:hypothetical protein [Patescibacteria group bacterium]